MKFILQKKSGGEFIFSLTLLGVPCMINNLTEHPFSSFK
jgi:hypothetical protein